MTMRQLVMLLALSWPVPSPAADSLATIQPSMVVEDPTGAALVLANGVVLEPPFVFTRSELGFLSVNGVPYLGCASGSGYGGRPEPSPGACDKQRLIAAAWERASHESTAVRIEETMVELLTGSDLVESVDVGRPANGNIVVRWTDVPVLDILTLPPILSDECLDAKVAHRGTNRVALSQGRADAVIETFREVIQAGGTVAFGRGYNAMSMRRECADRTRAVLRALDDGRASGYGLSDTIFSSRAGAWQDALAARGLAE